LIITVIVALNDLSRLQVLLPGNTLILNGRDEQLLKSEQIIMINVMWLIETD